MSTHLRTLGVQGGLQLLQRNAGAGAPAAAGQLGAARWLSTDTALAASDPSSGRPLNHEQLRAATEGRRTLIRTDERLQDFKHWVFKVSCGRKGVGLTLSIQHPRVLPPASTAPALVTISPSSS